jgi:hypothetical protein
MGDETVVLEGPTQIEFFKLAQACMRLKIETGTGMRFRQSTLTPVNRYYFPKSPKSRKQHAFELLDAAKARILNGANIWREIAMLREADFFFHCGHCGWEGDEFTVGGENEAWVCPNCQHDESAMDIQRLRSVNP